MLIKLVRFYQDEYGTLGWLEIPDMQRFYTLEGLSGVRIPMGLYTIMKRRGTRMADHYDERFRTLNHDGMLELRGVPGRSRIYIHVGNTMDDTRGCILVGNRYRSHPDNLYVSESVRAYRRIYPVISTCCDGEVADFAQILIIEAEDL